MYVSCSFKIRVQSANGAESLILWKRRKKGSRLLMWRASLSRRHKCEGKFLLGKHGSAGGPTLRGTRLVPARKGQKVLPI